MPQHVIQYKELNWDTPDVVGIENVNGTIGLNYGTEVSDGLVVLYTLPSTFTLSASPQSRSVAPGGSTTYDIAITPFSGFDSNVTLSVSGLPSGATGTFTPNPAAPPGYTILNISTSATTPEGVYVLVVNGTNGTINRTIAVRLVVSTVAPAPVFVVNRSSPACTASTPEGLYYSTIQGAVDAAWSGDTIVVCNGTYEENVYVGKPLNIRSLYGAAGTTVDAGGGPYAFYVDAGNTNISGFTAMNSSEGMFLDGVSNCNVSYNIAFDNFIGIELVGSSNNQLINNTAYSNTLWGIWLVSSNHNALYNNNATGNGDSGIYLSSSNGNALANNTVYNNPNGIVLYQSDGNDVSSNTVYNNSDQGVVVGGSGNNTLAGNNVSHNPGEGFLLMDNSDGNTITDNMVDSNGEGGGIVLLGSGGLNEDNVIANNTITNNPNGIYLSNSSGNTIVNCTIRDSTSYYFYSDSNSGNAVYDTYINTSKVSFTGLDIAIRAVEDPPTAPFDLYSIGKYLNISNNSAGSWIFLNMSYVEADLYVNESTLRMYRHDGAWEEVPEPNGVNTIDDYVYANITSFSVFAPNGDVAVAAPWHLCLCGKPWRWHHNRH